MIDAGLPERFIIEYHKYSYTAITNTALKYNFFLNGKWDRGKGKWDFRQSQKWFKNAVIGKDKHGHPIYSDVERRYCGLHLACYLEYEEYTPIQT